MLETLRVLVEMSLRNLFASRLKTIIVGGIVFFGALIVTVGSSFLDSIVNSMSRSIIGTVAGHAQIYSNKSKDELALFGSFAEPDLAQLDEFEKVRASLEKVPNVKMVVPMGISGALVTSGNTIDVVLQKLRDSVRKLRNGEDTPAVRALIEAEKSHARQIVTVLQGDMKNLASIADEKAIHPEDAAVVNKAVSAEFWNGFDQDPLGSLEFLENRIAPMATDADLLFVRYVGTDMESFARSFDRMKIVEGTTVPQGKRGFLFSKFFMEERLKLKSARRLDKIREAIDEKRQTIATNEDLQRMVRENIAQTREILLQLDPAKTAKMTSGLQKELGAPETDLGALLAKFFAADDSSFKRRYDYFYKEMAPLLELYRIRVGDTLTIKAFTKTGYMKSVNLRVYGAFDFKGLEKSPLAGALNVMDLVSFRELYGFLTADKLEEIKKLKEAAGARQIDRDKAEDELFGSGSQITAEATPGLAVAKELPESGRDDTVTRVKREDLVDRVYDASELTRGVVLNAAVILKDPTQVDRSIRDIAAAAKADGLDIRVVSWQQAAGLIGQLIYMFKMILYVAVLIIFLVALVIINNAMVMATLERAREIGTLRAVGAQRTFILGMLVIESLTVGAVFGGLGALVGAGIIKIIAAIGIPAKTDILFFFFSGPRLHPLIGGGSLIAAFVIVLLVSAFSSFYPAFLAMRVTPRQAMATAEE
jgi:ABC-type lipoprotein release transport system permease subunit